MNSAVSIVGVCVIVATIALGALSVVAPQLLIRVNEKCLDLLRLDSFVPRAVHSTTYVRLVGIAVIALGVFVMWVFVGDLRK